MTKLFQPTTVEAPIKEIQRRLHALECEAPTGIAFKDGNGQIRVVIGKLDVLGGVYVGKYGWVVLDATGTLVAAQYA